MVDAVGRAKEVSTKVTGSNPVLTTNFTWPIKVLMLYLKTQEEYLNIIPNQK